MNSIKQRCKEISESRWFEISIMVIIIINSILIGVELYVDSEPVRQVQNVILGIFTLEILIRFIAADSVVSFFKNGWNIFDLSLVLIGYIPAHVAAGGSTLLALRVLRVFRILRLLRAAKEIKLIVTVLTKSMSAMFYNMVLFLIFMYLYALIGVSLFKLPNPDKLTGNAKLNYEQYIQKAPHAPGNSMDPYGNLAEASFTLFRTMTGEDWTDLRYNLITASELDVVKASPVVITFYHVSWFCLAAFLLLNLVTGAIINNYQMAIEQQERKRKEQEKADEAKEKAGEAATPTND